MYGTTIPYQAHELPMYGTTMVWWCHTIVWHQYHHSYVGTNHTNHPIHTIIHTTTTTSSSLFQHVLLTLDLSPWHCSRALGMKADRRVS